MDKVEGLIRFSKASMVWCKEESEKASAMILETINHVAEDANRVSSVSESALLALKKVKSQVNVEGLQGDNRQKTVLDLSNALTDLKTQHDSIGSVVDPIVRALQFQDRVAQNLDNIGKMLECWWKYKGTEISEIEFGEILLKNTTMESERSIIRAAISGLPEEPEQHGSMMF